jgi:hypothetical protein
MVNIPATWSKVGGSYREPKETTGAWLRTIGGWLSPIGQSLETIGQSLGIVGEKIGKNKKINKLIKQKTMNTRILPPPRGIMVLT